MSNLVKKIQPYGNKNLSIPKEKKEDFISLEETTEIETIPDINSALKILKTSRKRKR